MTEKPTPENTDPCFTPITHDRRAMIIIWATAVISCLALAALLSLL
jgi:hypothetical protein